VNPGDLLHGDRNGVTTVPTELAPAVADACPELVAAEAVVLDYLKAGRPDPKGYADARAESHRRMQELGRRLRKAVW
jgi:regulator of RNase E activity RraA